MPSNTQSRKLNIFVHRASECLTDHESHGEGLICFSLLRGLAERGHHIYAYTNHAAIREMPERMQVRAQQHRFPSNSLAPWEHFWRAAQWLKEINQEHPIDLVWHMNPSGGSGSPRPPLTLGKPLVVGPLYYGWPDTGSASVSGRPRYGVSLQQLVEPRAARGWQRTLEQAALLFCATKRHAETMQKQLPHVRVLDLPLIVDPPPSMASRTGRKDNKSVSLLFVANLVPNKNPLVFCETIQLLNEAGMEARGTILGDGPERDKLEAWAKGRGIIEKVCFLGKVPNSEVYRHVSQADFLVSTSRGEPYGRGIAEAMSVGTPAVCHRSGGPADFIDDGIDGLLVEELTAAEYAGRIGLALAEPGAWEALSANARRKAEDWGGEVVLSRLEESLYAVVQDGKKG